MSTAEQTGVWVDIDSISPDPRNANTHPDKNLRAIEASLREHGQVEPLVVHNGIVIAGNGRLEVMHRLGYDRVWINRVDHMTYTQARRYAIEANRSAELAVWDMDVLESELSGLIEDGVNLADIGFDDSDVDGIMGNFDIPDDDEEQPRLDQREPIECPGCKTSFDPSTFEIVDG